MERPNLHLSFKNLVKHGSYLDTHGILNNYMLRIFNLKSDCWFGRVGKRKYFGICYYLDTYDFYLCLNYVVKTHLRNSLSRIEVIPDNYLSMCNLIGELELTEYPFWFIVSKIANKKL